jgi:GNAT superfamily N-acetyltransferase
MISFKKERAQDCFEEARPLLEEHWLEIAHYKDIILDPDYEAYKASEDAGFVRCYTSRDESGKLVGYALYFVRTNPHYRTSIQASQDILFVSKNHRGMGGRFIKWCDEQLRSEGVQVVYHHIKQAHNFGPMLERFGYELVDLIYARRLN